MKNYLIVLAGFNPLPNYISIMSNIKENQYNELFIVYTRDSENYLGTEKIAINLKRVIEKRLNNIEINSITIDKSDPRLIDEKIEEILNNISCKNEEWEEYSIILDYTGGTKILSSKFYSMLKEYQNEESTVNKLFNYVDAKRGKVSNMNSSGVESIINKDIILSPEEIIELHGFKIVEKSQDKIKLIDQEDKDIEVSKLEVEESNLKCTFNFLEDEKIGAAKLRIFKARDYTVRLGGDQAITVIKTVLVEKDRNILKKDFDRSIKNYVEDRLIIEPLE